LVSDHGHIPEWSRSRPGSLPRTGSDSGSSSARGIGTGLGSERGIESGSGSGSGRDIERETGRETSRELGSGRETESGREARLGRDTGRESRSFASIGTDNSVRGESSFTPRGHLEFKSSDVSGNDLMHRKGTVEPAKLGGWDGVNKVPSQGQGEAPSWARNREADRDRDRDREGDRVEDEDRSCLSDRTSDQPNAVTAAAGKKVVTQRAVLSDAQKDSIIRQIRAASAGRVRRPVPKDASSTDEEDTGRQGDTGDLAAKERTAVERPVVRGNSQGMPSRRQEQEQPRGVEGGRLNNADRDIVSGQQQQQHQQQHQQHQQQQQQQQQQRSVTDRTHNPPLLPSQSRSSSDPMYPRERVPEEGSATNYPSSVKLEIPGLGSRVRRESKVPKSNVTEGTQEEKEQGREDSRGQIKGALIECVGVHEDEVKRLAKFEKMRERKIAEALARALVSKATSVLNILKPFLRSIEVLK
jgi:hypothetical protein